MTYLHKIILVFCLSFSLSAHAQDINLQQLMELLNQMSQSTENSDQTGFGALFNLFGSLVVNLAANLRAFLTFPI
ncbi:MAG: hypothetical protein R2865_12375 [Deinococcales bacterium]